MTSSAALSLADRAVLTAVDSPPAELERVCGSVVTDALQAGLKSAPSASKFPCSESNTAVKDLIRRFVSGDGAGDSRAVTFQEAVGAIVTESMSSMETSVSVEDGSTPDNNILVASEEFKSPSGELVLSTQLARGAVRRAPDGLQLEASTAEWSRSGDERGVRLS